MPAFSAIGAYVAGTILGLTGTAAVVAGVGLSFAGIAVASIVSIGAAYVTSRLINGNANKGSNSVSNQGGRIQLPPASNNKIPVVYGSAYVNGIITDARITNENNEMYYCIVLSETSLTGAYSIDDIYLNDLRLIFETGAGNKHRAEKGVKYVDNDPVTQTEDFENSLKQGSTNLIEVRVYAGGSGSAQQIFPTIDTPVNAYSYWPDNTWTATNEMKGLVYAIVKVVYNADKGITGIPNMTFKLNNTLNNPAACWRDYMLAKRYGANVLLPGQTANDVIPTGAGTSYTEWYDYCDELIRFTDKDGNSTTQKRYTLNGVIDTSRSVKDNIDAIMTSGGAWLSYNVATGYWNPVIKKAVTGEFTGSISGTTLTVTAFSEGRIEPGMILSGTGVIAGTTIVSQAGLTGGESTGQIGVYTVSENHVTPTGSVSMSTEIDDFLEFTEENIISGITISSTRLDDLYNGYEAEFFDKYNKDQRAYTRDELDVGDRNPSEPDNRLRISYEFVNNSVQADILSSIELRQSRDDLAIEFTSSFYGIQAEAGDVIKVTNDVYGWNPKLFRVTRIKEIEQEDGNLVASIQALEYNGDVYTTEPLTEFTTEKNIGIPYFLSGGDQNNGNIRAPDNDDVDVIDVRDQEPVPYIILRVTMPLSGGPYDEIQVWSAEDLISTFPTADEYSLWLSHRPPPPNSTFDLGSTHDLIISGLPANQPGYQWYFKVRLGLRGIYSEFTDPDAAIISQPYTPYDPDPGAGSQEVLNIKEAILKLDFGKCVLPNNGFWVWKTMTQIDFGSLSTASPYQLDLGLTSVTENTVTAATDIEDFVWQVDPE